MAKVSELRGQARRHRQELTGRRDEVAGELRGHIRVCGTCTRARADVYARCDEGWTLTKLALRAQRAVEHYDNDHPSNQQSLFTGGS
jgi:hypothetical protein